MTQSLNLSVISKIIERVDNSRIVDHLTYNKLHNLHQSAYCKHHSTETVLLSLPHLRLNPLTEGFPWDDLRKIFCGCQRMAKVSCGEKQDQKAPRPIALLNDSFGNRRFLKVCIILNANFR